MLLAACCVNKAAVATVAATAFNKVWSMWPAASALSLAQQIWCCIGQCLSSCSSGVGNWYQHFGFWLVPPNRHGSITGGGVSCL